MKYKVYDNQYIYIDARDGTKYPAHTCTDEDEEDRPSGADLRFAIADGGDHTACKKSVGSIKALGTSR